MGCGGDREKGPPEHTQKWEFITLSDFKATSTWTSVAYVWLWIMAIVGVAVYALDTFTAVNLLVFNRWSSQIKPSIPLKYSKWIFAACILLSWALCFYEWFRAIRVIRRGGVAESYMDPLAVNVQSMRNHGWRRFLVFTELTRSKKGVDYVAFFVYFAFNGAIRIILAEGPRQFVNAITLYSVMDAQIEVHTKPTEGRSSVEQFFANIETLADSSTEQALILCSMLFTLVIWVFSALQLLIAIILYLVFLWHHIPQHDGRLSIYCRRKIDRRLETIVGHKIRAALEEEERQKQKAARRAEVKRQKTGDLAQAGVPTPGIGRQPTLPQLGDGPPLEPPPKQEKSSDYGLVRQDTSTSSSTLPPYSSRPPTRNASQQQLHGQPSLSDLAAAERPPMPSRMGTKGSEWTNTSYESDAPLLANAGYAGGGARAASPAPGVPPAAFDRQASNPSLRRPLPGRQGSQATQRSFTPVSARPPPPGPGRPPIRANTGFSSFEDPSASAMRPGSPHDSVRRPPRGAPGRANTSDSFGPMSRPDGRTPPPGRRPAPPSVDRMPTYGSLHSQQSSFSRPVPQQRQMRVPSPFADDQPPSPQPNSYEMTVNPTFTNTISTSPPPLDAGYAAFTPPARNTSSPAPLPTVALPSQLQPGPSRNVTVAGRPGAEDNYFGHVHDVPQRSATAPLEARLTTGYGDILDDYGDSARNSIVPPEPAYEPHHPSESGIRRPSPAVSPAGLDRAYTTGPAEPSWLQQYHRQQQQQHGGGWQGNRF